MLDWIHEHVEKAKQHLSPDHALHSTNGGGAKSRVSPGVSTWWGAGGCVHELLMLWLQLPTKWPLNMFLQRYVDGADGAS
jgi:hypothetical protein